jgi:hypothetical protein
MRAFSPKNVHSGRCSAIIPSQNAIQVCALRSDARLGNQGPFSFNLESAARGNGVCMQAWSGNSPARAFGMGRLVYAKWGYVRASGCWYP